MNKSEEKKKIKDEYKNKQKQLFLESLPMETALFLKLFAYLNKMSEIVGCKDDFSLTLHFLEDNNIDIEKVISFLENNGSYCDCEVLSNTRNLFEEYDLLEEDLENKLVYDKESEEQFFQQIEELTDNNKFLACIEALESIPKKERDYRISYQLARAYQNFAICGEDEKGTEYELGSELLLKSISILESVKEVGHDKAEWNRRMAYGYQYLEDKEELAIPYALRWSKLDPSDEDAMLVVEECKEAIKNRVKKQILAKIYEIAENILKSYNITGSHDYCNRDDKELDEIDEKIHLSIKDYYVGDEEDIIDIIKNILKDLDNAKENTNEGNHMEKIKHSFFGEPDLVNGLDDESGIGDDVIVLWEEKINEINTTLWYDKQFTITTEILDAFTQFLNNFDEYDKKARKSLEKYLSEDNTYIVFHRDELNPDLPEDIEQFVRIMKVTNIGLWLDEESSIIVDYMIVPEESNEILAVKFDSNFEIVDIAWES